MPRFTCNISRYPDDSLTVVVFTNLDAGHARRGLVAYVIAELADPALAPKKLTAIDDANPELLVPLRKLLDRSPVGLVVATEPPIEYSVGSGPCLAGSCVAGLTIK